MISSFGFVFLLLDIFFFCLFSPAWIITHEQPDLEPVRFRRPESAALTTVSHGQHHICERACCTISTKTVLVSAGLHTSRKNAMRAPRMPSWVFNLA